MGFINVWVDVVTEQAAGAAGGHAWATAGAARHHQRVLGTSQTLHQWFEPGIL